MACVHPDRAGHLESVGAVDECGVRGLDRAGDSLPVQKRKRKKKRSESRDQGQLIREGEMTAPDGDAKRGADHDEEQLMGGSEVTAPGGYAKRGADHDEEQLMGGGEVIAPDGYTKNVGNDGLGSRRPKTRGQEKKAKANGTRGLQPTTLDADPSKRPRVETPKASKRKDNRRPLPRGERRRVDAEKLERAERLAHNYPDIRDTEAWRELGQQFKRSSHAEHAFVYRQLRFNQCPKGLSFKHWKIRVHEEMEKLGLEDAYTGPPVSKAPKGKVKDESMQGVTQGKAETMEDEQRRREMERIIADDGLDIDIYGDEETRRKYEPWIRSRMDRT